MCSRIQVLNVVIEDFLCANSIHIFLFDCSILNFRKPTHRQSLYDYAGSRYCPRAYNINGHLNL